MLRAPYFMINVYPYLSVLFLQNIYGLTALVNRLVTIYKYEYGKELWILCNQSVMAGKLQCNR